MEYRYETVKRYVKEHNLDVKSRKREIVDKRAYLSKYLRVRGETFEKIAKTFNLHHATVIHACNKYDLIRKDLDFILNCTDLIMEFPIIGNMADFRETIARNNQVMINLNSEEYVKLQSYRIDNMIYTNENAIKHMIDNCNNF